MTIYFTTIFALAIQYLFVLTKALFDFSMAMFGHSERLWSSFSINKTEQINRFEE